MNLAVDAFIWSAPNSPLIKRFVECDAGLSSFDVAHRLLTSSLYDIPIG